MYNNIQDHDFTLETTLKFSPFKVVYFPNMIKAWGIGGVTPELPASKVIFHINENYLKFKSFASCM